MERELIERSRSAQDRACAGLSGYKVGASIQSEDGTLFDGANIEPAITTLGLCAERVALASALAAGHRRFKALAVATPEDVGVFPCGACRQMLLEFAGPSLLILAVGTGGVRRAVLGDLLPEGFRPLPRRRSSSSQRGGSPQCGSPG